MIKQTFISEVRINGYVVYPSEDIFSKSKIYFNFNHWACSWWLYNELKSTTSKVK